MLTFTLISFSICAIAVLFDPDDSNSIHHTGGQHANRNGLSVGGHLPFHSAPYGQKEQQRVD